MNPLSKSKYESYLNSRFGKLLLIELFYDTTKSGRSKYNYICKCDCGNTSTIPCWYILERGQKSCGCSKYETKIDYSQNVGKRFGNLIILELSRLKLNNDTQNKLYYKIQCDCGTIKYQQVHLFHKYNYQSCGCKQSKDAIETNKTLIGTEINNLVILEYKYDGNSTNKKHLFRCKCKCGNDNYWISKRDLYSHIHSCCDKCNSKSKNSYSNLLSYCSLINLKLISEFTTKCSSILKDNGKVSTIYNSYDFQCLNCNNIFNKTLSPSSLLICPFCNDIHISNAEKIIALFLQENNIQYRKIQIPSFRDIQNTIEIDFYIPDYNIGIELHGLVTHATTYNDYSNYFIGTKPKNYHLNKIESCESNNIDLLQFWNTEIFQKEEIVKSIILNRLNKSKYSNYARKCYIKEIDKSTYDHFINNNHIQGTTFGESIRLGLFYKKNDNLVSVMSFGHSRYDSYEYEMFRFSTYRFCNVIGSASKLFKYFLNNYNPKSIVTYSDRRLFNSGKLYNILGFTFSHNSNPNYWYFNRYGYEKSIKLYHRSNFQKHILSTKLNKFDPNLTEWENMEMNNYLRIYDCGNKVYIWQR